MELTDRQIEILDSIKFEIKALEAKRSLLDKYYSYIFNCDSDDPCSFEEWKFEYEAAINY